jgi:hypothetical protein
VSECHPPSVTGVTPEGVMGVTQNHKKEPSIESKDLNTCAPNGSRFEEWYAQYPKKKGKAEAFKAWKRKKLDTVADSIIADTIKRAQIEWTDPQFIPMASTYVNQERWQDEDCKPRTNGVSNTQQAHDISHDAIMKLGGYDNLPF